ncbi:MAG: hypothetical protein F6K40_16905 [Okeania sp. SIO3I5]|uniref:hypothetical protein n=1 Tax=Okeania sp. SIO3I5 TaxID=2607805 RepID=UPI0013B6D22E|nr:hypothetical protein [Okeania sp. SIO3I5]NEQ37848.1 hypothetical protein [Okeania sp. SIO3I5]
MQSITLEKLLCERANQNFSDYQIQAHRNWRQLLNIQLESIEDRANQAFIEGLENIKDLIQDIPSINHLSGFLQEEIGWQLWPVIGLLEADKFFYLLSHRYFPVVTFVRSNTDINFSPFPDLWHDIFGHIPLLFSQTYSNFLQYLGYQYVTVENANRKDIKQNIARLFWYTIEAGVCYEKGKLRVYGATQLSSIEEIKYALSDRPIRYPFKLEEVINFPVEDDRVQDRLFEIPSFEYLRVIQDDFDSYLKS